MTERKALKLEWQQAPVKTQWGQDMVVASVAIDKDHTLDLYCERDQTQKVETMLTQRTWVELTDGEIAARAVNFYNPEMYKRAVLWAQEKLKERNQ